MDPSTALDALGDLLASSHRLIPSDLPSAVVETAHRLGATGAAMYVIDYEQRLLLGFGVDEELDVEGTVGGRAYRAASPLAVSGEEGGTRAWFPMLDGADRLGVLRVDLEGELDEQRERCFRHLATIAGDLVAGKQVIGDDIERLRRREPMTLAAELRWAMLPPLSFQNDRVEVAALVSPAYEIAGDTFDYALNGSTLHVGVFDAMGHGLEASRLANLAVVAYRSSRRSGEPIGEALRRMDEVVAEQFGTDRFVTGQLATLDIDSGALRVLSAGHPRPLLLRRDRVIGELPCESTFPIGFGDLDVTVTEVALEPGDRLVFYTDGVVEARSPSGDEFGLERLGDLVARAAQAHEPPAETVRRLVHSVLAHESGQLRDDATVLLVGWPAPP